MHWAVLPQGGVQRLLLGRTHRFAAQMRPALHSALVVQVLITQVPPTHRTPSGQSLIELHVSGTQVPATQRALRAQAGVQMLVLSRTHRLLTQMRPVLQSLFTLHPVITQSPATHRIPDGQSVFWLQVFATHIPARHWKPLVQAGVQTLLLSSTQTPRVQMKPVAQSEVVSQSLTTQDPSTQARPLGQMLLTLQSRALVGTQAFATHVSVDKQPVQPLIAHTPAKQTRLFGQLLPVPQMIAAHTFSTHC